MVVQSQEDRTRAAITSFIFHVAFLAILWFYKISTTETPTVTPEILIEFNGGGGDDAAAGEPDKGMNDKPTDVGQQLEDPTSKTTVPDPEPTPPTKTTPVPPTKTSPPKTDIPKTSPTTEDPDVAAIKKAQKEKAEAKSEADRQKKTENDRIAAAEREKQRQANEAADAKRKAQEEYDKQKGKFGGQFGKPGGTGQGQGGGGKPGNGGTPSGTGDNPFGKSSGTGGGTGGGSGTGDGEGIGGGLKGRKVVSRPTANCPVSEKGKVVVKVTVNSAGSVISATATIAGSTLTDAQSRSCAEETAKRFKFAGSDAASQSGTIEVRFNFN